MKGCTQSYAFERTHIMDADHMVIIDQRAIQFTVRTDQRKMQLLYTERQSVHETPDPHEPQV